MQSGSGFNSHAQVPDLTKGMVILLVRKWASGMGQPDAGEEFIRALVTNDHVWRTWPSRKERFVHMLFASFGMGYRRGMCRSRNTD